MAFVFQEVHDDRCGDVVGKVRNDLDIFTVVFFLNDGVNICFQDILIQDSDVVIVCQCLLQDRDEGIVDFDSNHLSCVFCQHLCQGANTGADFQHTVVLCDAGTGSDVIQNIGIDQEVLTKVFLKGKAVCFDDLFCSLGGGNSFCHVFLLLENTA